MVNLPKKLTSDPGVFILYTFFHLLKDKNVWFGMDHEVVLFGPQLYFKSDEFYVQEGDK
jgi:hypothetical protein